MGNGQVTERCGGQHRRNTQINFVYMNECVFWIDTCIYGYRYCINTKYLSMTIWKMCVEWGTTFIVNLRYNDECL